ncbi:MAG: SRPBCC family protein [Erythrobacter sp.]|uniref:SRPBCC family protein n=1 Tax=Erythrobacter sp. TaxID=1042 RepID=UPI0032EDB837
MTRFTIRTACLAAGLGLAALALPASAEVVEQEDHSFVTRDEAIVASTPKQVWLALISPARWWNSAHTWSGEAANLRLKPQAGGCFCETIPEVDEPRRFTLEGSVEHMRVIQAYPERALVMRGALGPLQPEPVTGVLTIAISEVDQGTRIVWEYNVGGFMRFETEVIARAVDGVMSEQLAGLAGILGPVDPAEIDTEAEAEAEAEAAPVADPGGKAMIEPEAVIDEAPQEGGEPSPSVDEAFGDFIEDGK